MMKPHDAAEVRTHTGHAIRPRNLLTIGSAPSWVLPGDSPRSLGVRLTARAFGSAALTFRPLEHVSGKHLGFGLQRDEQPFPRADEKPSCSSEPVTYAARLLFAMAACPIRWSTPLGRSHGPGGLHLRSVAGNHGTPEPRAGDTWGRPVVGRTSLPTSAGSGRD